ncbi:MAG TPA: hypothetical protein VF062_21155 [Candidatus Limnocylindrales bacterium]
MTQVKLRVKLTVLGAVLLCFAVPASLSIDGGDGIGWQRDQLMMWLFFAAPSLLATWVLVNRWWTGPGERLSTMDGPARLLAIAVAAMPDDRKEWAVAMEAELTQVQGRSARWGFALDTARAAVIAQRGLRRPAPRRIAPSPAAAVIVVLAVAGCIATTAYAFVHYPTTAERFGPVKATILAAILAGCVWLALRPPRSLMTSRRGRWIGIASGFVLSGYLLLTDFMMPEGTGDAGELAALGLLMSFLVIALVGVQFLGALYVAGMESFRSGIQTAVWSAMTGMLLSFSVWMVMMMRKHPPDSPVPNVMAGDLSEAGFWTLIWFPVWGLPFGILGAALSGVKTQRQIKQETITWTA